MKNLLLLFLAISFSAIQAQDYQSIINNKFEKISKQLSKIEIREGDYKICNEEKTIDDNGILQITGVAKYIIKTNGKNVYSEINQSNFTDGDTTKLFAKIYSSHRYDDNYFFKTIDLADSSILYTPDSLGALIPYVKFTSLYDNDLISSTFTYVDFGILFGEQPSGFFLSNVRKYHYNSNKQLSYITTATLNFNTAEIEKSDSIVSYYNDNKEVEEITFKYNKESLEYYPTEKYKYIYEENKYPVFTEDYEFNNNSWVLSSRTNHFYDSKNREILSIDEDTYDNGSTWINRYRNSTIFDAPTLYLGFANKQVSERWNDSAWSLDDINIFTDCGSIPDNTLELSKLNFEARFSNETIILDSDKLNITASTVQLTDLQGRLVFSKRFNELPNTIHTSGLTSGIYILNIRTKDSFGVKKLMKK